MPPVGFEPTISAGERPKTYALDRAATGTGYSKWVPLRKKKKAWDDLPSTFQVNTWFGHVTSRDVWWRWRELYQYRTELRVPTLSREPAPSQDGYATHIILFSRQKIFTNTYGRTRLQNPKFSNLGILPTFGAHCTTILEYRGSGAKLWITLR